MLTKINRTMCEQSENFNKDIENITKYQREIVEIKNTVTEKFMRGFQQQST